MFDVVDQDMQELENVEKAIAAGGQIFIALDDDGTPIA